MKTIWAHTLVKNEENYIWYAVMSVINWVDKILIWDTGSTDKTVDIIKEIIKKFPNKIDFKEVGDVSIDEFTRVRQEMLDETKSDWFIMLDGDEIWWDESINKVAQKIKKEGNRIETIFVPNILLIGDIYHYQEEKAGQYKIAGKKGHFNIRAINKSIPGLSSQKPHGTWGWTDKGGKMIQDRKNTVFVDAPYLHATFLQRTKERKADLKVPKRAKKLKYEIGIPFSKDFYYPEIFFRPRPSIVPSPWNKMSPTYVLRGGIETPLKKIKRRILPAKVGY